MVTNGKTKDSLGLRMKNNYENRYRFKLPRRSNTIIRVDGKAFHTFTKGCVKPFDQQVESAMDCAAIALLNNVMGARFAYVQSDEISVLVTDYSSLESQAWFDGSVQKISSVSASIATAGFNVNWDKTPKLALFDSRVFCIPELAEVSNYFLWRYKDATKNAISMVGQSMFSHKELQGVKTSELREKIGVDIHDHTDRSMFGGLWCRGEGKGAVKILPPEDFKGWNNFIKCSLKIDS